MKGYRTKKIARGQYEYRGFYIEDRHAPGSPSGASAHSWQRWAIKGLHDDQAPVIGSAFSLKHAKKDIDRNYSHYLKLAGRVITIK